ncbi:MAG TPA: SpoIID/LytB domain-containing protein [Oculatellaceae cyanobacterium]|jgi:SpoIID/LytB domain protein
MLIIQAETGKKLSHLSRNVLMAFCLFGLTGASGPSPKIPEVELKVGIVQRFGEEPNQELTLEATKGDRLTLHFLAGNMQPQTLEVEKIKLEALMQALPVPAVDERLVLGNYRSFETAEDTAETWRKKGIAVELAQPERWHVWAKRSVYNTPLLRRLLLKNLQEQGQKTAYLDTNILPKQTRVSWVVNGLRYNRKNLEITSKKDLIKVKKGKDDQFGRIYGGSLRLKPNSYGTYTLINEVPLETYLRGVVPHEIDYNAPYGAMEAQAIIARTYALKNLRRFAIDGYQICADTQCQVYKGLTGTSASSDQAIAATKSQVLTYDNQIVDALYSSTTGGVTAQFDDVWNGAKRPYLKPVIDSTQNIWDLSRRSLANEENLRQFISLKQGFNEKGWNTFRWRRTSTLTDITKDLQRYLKKTKHPLANFKKIEQIAVVERSPAGRILKLGVETDKGVVEVYKDDVRSAFIAPRSTLFYLEPVYNKDKTFKGYTFVGGGLGHGVGLSQTGAYNLAKKGWTGEQILSFYYPGTQIQAINNKIFNFNGQATSSTTSKN